MWRTLWNRDPSPRNSAKQIRSRSIGDDLRGEMSAFRQVMPERRRKFDAEFREGAVRLVHETGKSIAQIARDLGINEGTLGNWVVRDRASRNGADGLSHDDLAELKRLRAEVAELRMERDVLKRSVVLWVKEATK